VARIFPGPAGQCELGWAGDEFDVTVVFGCRAVYRTVISSMPGRINGRRMPRNRQRDRGVTRGVCDNHWASNRIDGR